MASNMLDAAMEYASMGWRVFPLLPRSKEPATKHGFKDATDNTGQVKAWWTANPDYNIGIATGNGLCVVDVDDKPKNLVQGSDELRDWELANEELSHTVTAITGTKGVHYYYDVGEAEVPSCQSDTVFIDLRCDGGYVVAPPSVHPNGQPYVWEVAPSDMEPAKATRNDKSFIQWVYDNRRGKRKEGDKVTVPDGKVREGEGRNNFLYEQGCSARAKGSDDAVVSAFLDALNREKCSPPLDSGELEKVVRSVCSKPIGLSDEAKEAQKSRRGRPRKFEHNKVARELIEKHGACLVDGVTPAIRDGSGRYRMGWDAFDAVMISMHDDCTVSNRREVKAYIAAIAKPKMQSPATLIAFTNGVLDVTTMEFRDWREDDVIPNVIPHRWNPDARGEELDAMLYRMSCDDIGTALNLTEFIGVCMMRSVKQCPFFPVLIGEGSNGKSTYIGLLKDILGLENISGLQPKDIASKFLGVHIVGKTANLGDDIASGYLDDKDCSVIKSVATGDIMFTDIKGGTGFSFEPYCTMVFSCNQFPRLADTTPGFMRRLFPVEFRAVFTRDDPDYDPLIGEKLRHEETLEHACVVGVEGLRRVIQQHGPTPNSMSEAMKADIAREGNTCLQWFHDDGITADHLVGMTKEEAHREYLDWCERNGYGKTAMGSATMSSHIATYFRLKCSGFARRNQKTVRVYERK